MGDGLAAGRLRGIGRRERRQQAAGERRGCEQAALRAPEGSAVRYGHDMSKAPVFIQRSDSHQSVAGAFAWRRRARSNLRTTRNLKITMGQTLGAGGFLTTKPNFFEDQRKTVR
jgi:hypothetical protein